MRYRESKASKNGDGIFYEKRNKAKWFAKQLASLVYQYKVLEFPPSKIIISPRFALTKIN